MTSAAIDTLASLDRPCIDDVVGELGAMNAAALARDFTVEWAHPEQLTPAGQWQRWVIMGGRGFGKTRAGAEWIVAQAGRHPQARIALVAATLDEARAVMVEGESGLLAVAGDRIAAFRPSLGLVEFASGAQAQLFSGASPSKLRGPQHHFAWCDELAKWRHPRESWAMLQLGLRLGPNPRAVITTTPQPGRMLEELLAMPGTVRTGGGTADNIHLSPAFQKTVDVLYRGTRLERQELFGELLPDRARALWSVETIEGCRVSTSLDTNGEGEGCSRQPFASSEVERPRLSRTVIGVDPPSGDGTCGIVACARSDAGIAYVLADHSVGQRSPEGWARAVADAARAHGNGGLPAQIVAERNQGGAMVEAVLKAAAREGEGPLKVKLVHAATAKAARADPVAALFTAGKVKLAGVFPELEAELRGFRSGQGHDAGGWESVTGGSGSSPDRADAMVWALTELMLEKQPSNPRVRFL